MYRITISQITHHKFLLFGQTYLPNDQDFGIIEKSKRFHGDIFVPHDLVAAVAEAKKTKPHFVVTELTYDDFVSTKALLDNAVNRKVTVDEESVKCLHIQWIHFDGKQPNIIVFQAQC